MNQHRWHRPRWTLWVGWLGVSACSAGIGLPFGSSSTSTTSSSTEGGTSAMSGTGAGGAPATSSTGTLESTGGGGTSSVSSSGSGGMGGGAAPCFKEGEYQCAGQDTVMQCKVNPATNTLQYVDVVHCASAGLANGCSAPPVDFQVTKPEDFCSNACGVRGVPLMGMLCAMVSKPGLECAVLTCGEMGTMLVPDHTTCLPAGQLCSKNEDCKSCLCANMMCIGSIKKTCSPICP